MIRRQKHWKMYDIAFKSLTHWSRSRRKLLCSTIRCTYEAGFPGHPFAYPYFYANRRIDHSLEVPAIDIVWVLLAGHRNRIQNHIKFHYWSISIMSIEVWADLSCSIRDCLGYIPELKPQARWEVSPSMRAKLLDAMRTLFRVTKRAWDPPPRY